MRINNYLSYYLLLLLFPVSFLLHNVNENFGLVSLSVILYLLLKYVATAVCIAFVSKLLLRSYSKAFLFSFFLLLINFLFGVYKDFAKAAQLPAAFNSYSLLLPELVLLIITAAVFLLRKQFAPVRFVQALTLFLLINFAYETGWCLYNLATRKDLQQDFGDQAHNTIRKLEVAPAAQKPTVFWLVFDEYAASSSLKKVWGFHNPLDSTLRSKGFFVADSARSNYNFTHYSFTSTLDMVYLRDLKNHSVVRLKDAQRGIYSVYDNNVTKVFEQNGYAIHNYTIFPMQDHPTQSFEMFAYVPEQLINFQTLEGRIRGDIGWNFSHLLQRNRHAADSIAGARVLEDLDTAYKNQVSRFLTMAAAASHDNTPSFNLLHLQLPHEPYFYRADGSIAYQNGYSDSARHYIPHLQYTNQVVDRVTDSLLALYSGQDLVIIIQGDHGFKFQEADPLYDQESCKILYAVYCSDRRYAWWPRSLSIVNSFRIVFNKYFQAGLPLLPDHSYNLYYR